ncbi:MAG TPA: endonuclease/exonuclease/phosphatase, partial [Flavipsychrobacter sp.]
MKGTEILLALLLLALPGCTAQENTRHCAVAFYNVENLFDTVDDPATMDDEFTPTGRYRYTDKVYRQKLHNIATVIGELNAALVGLAEIENSTVLKDLAAQPELKKYNYKYAWYNSPDPRGIDVALLYEPARFKVIYTKAIPVRMKGMATRDILYVKGILDGDTVHVHVNHWPSRGEGMAESAPKRRAAAMVAEENVRGILAGNPRAKIIIM